jgi:hypothetical protein
MDTDIQHGHGHTKWDMEMQHGDENRHPAQTWTYCFWTRIRPSGNYAKVHIYVYIDIVITSFLCVPRLIIFIHGIRYLLLLVTLLLFSPLLSYFFIATFVLFLSHLSPSPNFYLLHIFSLTWYRSVSSKKPITCIFQIGAINRKRKKNQEGTAKTKGTSRVTKYL